MYLIVYYSVTETLCILQFCVFVFLQNIVSCSSQVDERLGTLAVMFISAEAFHDIVPIIVDAVHALAYVAVACLTLLLGNIGDVNIVRGVEQLGLATSHRLEEIQFKLILEPSPRLKHKAGAYAVVAMEVEGPVREDDVGIFLNDDFLHFLVAVHVYLGVTVHL